MKRWQRVMQQLPTDWEAQALSSKNISTRSIGAFIYANRCYEESREPKGVHQREILECEKEACVKFNVKATPYERAGFVVNGGTPDQIRRCFNGEKGFSIYSLYERCGVKYNPSNPSTIARGRTADLEILVDFVKLVSLDNLAKAWKAQAAAYNTDRPGTGDADKGKRLNELWTEVKKILTPVVAQVAQTPAQSPVSAEAKAATQSE
jgi:hypothetical protein